MDKAIERFDKPRYNTRFTILPIIILDKDDREEAFRDLLETRGVDKFNERGIPYQQARTDAEIIGHIVKAMPVRLGIVGWGRR